MFDIYYPKSVYEALPYLYILVGLLGVFVPDTFGQLAGAILSVCAGRILGLRSAYRHPIA